MLTGQRLFAAGDVSETIAAVLTKEPEGTQLPDATPEELLFVRSLVTGEERELSDTEGAPNPFWSPDSTRIAYFRPGDLGWDLRVVRRKGAAVCSSAVLEGRKTGLRPSRSGEARGTRLASSLSEPTS
jgi:hypothetical protein